MTTPNDGEFAGEASTTMAWRWADGSDCMVYTRRPHVLEFNYRARRQSSLRREVEAEFAALGRLNWEFVAQGAWFWLCFVKRRHVFDELGTRIARRCDCCGTCFTPILRSHLRHCSDRCLWAARSRRYIARIKASPERHARYLEDVRARRAQAKEELAKSPELRAKHLAAQRANAAKYRRTHGMREQHERRVPIEARYGAWTVLREVTPHAGAERRLLCRCKCGFERAVRLVHLRSGASGRCRACGQRDRALRSGRMAVEAAE